MRDFSIGALLPTVLVPPTLFISLLLAVWAWKCGMIVLFQNRLLYLSWLPPLARSDKIEEFAGQCKPIDWNVEFIRSLDRVRLAVCVGRLPKHIGSMEHTAATISEPVASSRKVVIAYFQGNGGSTPLRLPVLSGALKRLIADGPPDTDYEIVALSYRGYWKSKGRPSQPGIERDAQAFLDWISETYGQSDSQLDVVLWGHSLGSAVASTALARYLKRVSDATPSQTMRVAGLILETPSTSTKDVLVAIYPQKWLPYRYLRHFLWNNWRTAHAIEQMGQMRNSGIPVPPVLIMCAGNDELIPAQSSDRLVEVGKASGLSPKHVVVPGALHNEASSKGRQALVDFIISSTNGGGASGPEVKQ